MTFDEKAKTWDDNPLFIERAKTIADEIRNFVKPAKTAEAFEYGCGTGLLSYFLQEDFANITLADTSKGMLEMLNTKIEKENIKNFHPLLLDLGTSEYKEKKFDVIFTSMAMHHVDDVSKVMHEFYEMLNPGGYLCIADLDKEDGSFHSHDPEFNGHFGFAKDVMEKHFTENGFTFLDYKTCLSIEKLFENNQKKTYPVFLMTGKK
ncbi:MAG: class I SAM-dependent methyltransferase [Bacteroidetes bacterium]|nr:class I SAM-dependent methyltransferase [Bacteroidota bacterium]